MKKADLKEGCEYYYYMKVVLQDNSDMPPKEMVVISYSDHKKGVMIDPKYLIECDKGDRAAD